MINIDRRLQRAKEAMQAAKNAMPQSRNESAECKLLDDLLALTSDEDAECLRSRVQERRKELVHLPILERWRAYWPEWFDRMVAECGPLFDHHGVPRPTTGETHAA